MVITWRTEKIDNGQFRYIVKRVGYQHQEIIQTGIRSTRAQAKGMAQRWVRYLKAKARQEAAA